MLFRSTIPNNYVWRNFKPVPGELFFSEEEKTAAKKIISDAKKFWKENHIKKFKNYDYKRNFSFRIRCEGHTCYQGVDWCAYNEKQ